MAVRDVYYTLADASFRLENGCVVVMLPDGTAKLSSIEHVTFGVTTYDLAVLDGVIVIG